MKVNAHVTSADDHGDRIRLVLQGSAIGDADWRPMLRFEVFVPENNRNRKSFHLGRKVKVEITPQ